MSDEESGSEIRADPEHWEPQDEAKTLSLEQRLQAKEAGEPAPMPGRGSCADAGAPALAALDGAATGPRGSWAFWRKDIALVVSSTFSGHLIWLETFSELPF